MKLLEMKNNLALRVAATLFKNDANLIFIGGTALNAFYLNYRYSEDADFGYIEKSKKGKIENILRKNGYVVERTNFSFRNIVSIDAMTIKMDIIEYHQKYSGFVEKELFGVCVKTLDLEEFILDKTISFLTRETFDGITRDAYDLYVIEQKYASVLTTLCKARAIVKRHVNVIEYNIRLLLNQLPDAENIIRPYLKRDIETKDLQKFINKLRGILK